MGGFNSFVCLFLVNFCCIISLSNAYSFKAGGKDGWILNPSENYGDWSKRQRFIINDTITFTYTKGSDSVLAVNKDDYDNCNINNPISKMDDGNSVFNLDKAGPFFFISGNKSKCDQGLKLSVVVISPRGRNSKINAPLASPPSPTTMASPPAMTPTSPDIPTMPSSPPMSMPSSPPMSMPGSDAPMPMRGSGAPMSMPGSEAPMSTPGSEAPIMSTPGSEAPVLSTPGTGGAPLGAPLGAPPPTSLAATVSPSVAFVASVWFVTSVTLSSFGAAAY